MRNAGLNEAQAGIKIARRNINNLRYADDSVLMAESEEELKSLLMRVKEESERAGLKLNIKKNQRSWHLAPFSSVQFSSVAQSCPTLCDPMNRSTPGLPVHHQLLEFTQTTSIESVMPSSHLILGRPLLLLRPISPSISLFQWVNSSHEVAIVLELQL